MMSYNNHMNNQRSIFFSYAEPSRFGGAGRVERKSFVSVFSSISKMLLLAMGLAWGSVEVWAQPEPLDATNSYTYNYENRITLHCTRAGTHRFTLAPEDKSKTGRSHWPIIFIDYENNGKNIREMINLTEEREFEVNVTGASSNIGICGDNGVWKLVAVGQDLRALPTVQGQEMRYINVNDNLLSGNTFTLCASNFPKLETIYAERNLFQGRTDFMNYNGFEFDYLRRVSFMENKVRIVNMSDLKSASYINFSKNLLTQFDGPPTFKTTPSKVFKGGNADTYTNNPEGLYETIGENDVKFDLTVNRLNIATLPNIPVSTDPAKPFLASNYLYTLQSRYSLPRSAYSLVTDEIDLSSQAVAMGVTNSSQKTKFRFYVENDAATDDYTLIPEDQYEEVSPGKFRFLRGMGAMVKIFAAMTTEAFPNPLESYELGTVDSSFPQWGYTGVLKQPEGTPSADRETYKNDLPNNTIGDGTTRELSKRFYRTNTFTINAQANNYWYGFESNDWGNPKNWTGGYVPPTTLSDYAGGTVSNVEFATTSNYPTAAIRDLHTDQNRRVSYLYNRSESGKSVVVNPGHGLIVDRLYTAPSTSGPHAGSDDLSYRLVLRAEEGKPNAAFYSREYYYKAINSSVDSYSSLATVPATVELYSKAFDGNRDKQNATWQYFGLPFSHGISSSQLPASAWVRRYEREKNDDGDEKWVDLAENEMLTAGTAYEITQPTPALYRFTGELSRSTKTWQISRIYSPTNYNDMNILANPFSHPIPIMADRMSWPQTADRTIYLYNTGSRKDWENNNGANVNSDTAPGAYTIGVPIDVANRLPGMPTQIPTLSAFLVKSNTGLNFSSELRMYNGWTPIPMEENRSQEYLPSIWMTVESEATTDQLWLVETDEATDDHDDGYDGEKIFTSGHVQLYALDSKDYQVSAKPELKHTDLAFVAGDEAGQYTLNIQLDSKLKSHQYYLVDNQTGVTQPLHDGMRYTFSAKSSDPIQRFAITTEPTAVKEVKAQNYDIHVDAQRTVTVHNHTDEAAEVKIFDAAGKNVTNFSVAANGQDSETLFAPGVYVIHVNNAQAQVTQRYVVH